jgi:D-3-phosphoglycerate dehydrogenase
MQQDMLRPRVVLTDHPWPDLDMEREIFGSAGLELVAGGEAAAAPEEIERLIERADPIAILTCWAVVTAKAIAYPKSLSIVARLGVGLDNIAVDAATARGTWVTNVPDYCVQEVGDHAIGLMLAHYRGIVRLDAAVKSAGWEPSGAGLERIGDLTVAIIGYGRIGKETARKLRAFGCRVLAVSPNFEAADEWAEPTDLAGVQALAEVIILHAPLTGGTAYVIDVRFLSGCLKKPLLINVSRGGLVDNAALERALRNGLLRGAALDVIDGEPHPPMGLMQLPNVIVTPHVAFASTASIIELRRRACEEVVRAVRGEPLHHPRNQPARGVPLAGGVASDVRVIAGPNGPEVVKKALAKLKVAADWFSDPARSATEVAAIHCFAELLGPGVVPEILWVKPQDNTFAMRLVDPRLRNWKKDLLAGHIDLATGARLGELLGQLHSRSADSAKIRALFSERTYFHELRVEPFFLRAAERLPALRDRILATVEGMEARCSALVHGDFSPKNILADGVDVVILDFEVAHWGDPRFDVAFCMAHLMLKALRRGAPERALFDLMTAFLNAYRLNGPAILDNALVKIMACLMLARLEGSSPVDYLADLDLERVRACIDAMLTDDTNSIDYFLNPSLELI